MVRSPRCAHAGAQPGSAAGSPGSAALAVARLAQRRGERPLGEGREAGAACRRFRAENSSKGRATLSAVPAPPHPPGNYFQRPQALSSTSRRTKPFLLGVRGLASSEEGRVSASLGPRPGARPARNHRNGGSHHRPTSRSPGAAGLAALATPVLLKEWLVLR